MAKGIKVCGKCGNECGARSRICLKCGYSFKSHQVAPKMLRDALALRAPKTYKELGKGRKQCPSCETIMGARVLKCSKCDHDFFAEAE